MIFFLAPDSCELSNTTTILQDMRSRFPANVLAVSGKPNLPYLVSEALTNTNIFF